MERIGVLIVGGGPAGLAAALAAKENGASSVLILERDQDLADLAAVQAYADENDILIYVGFVGMHLPKGADTLVLHECDTYWFAFKHGAEKSVGVTLGSPFLAEGIMSGADAFVNLYGKSPYLIEAFVEGLFGEIPFEGKTPVNMKPPKIVLD